MRFLSKDAEINPGNTIRIDTWRNTLQLFHRYNKPKFVGPFYAAGYKNYSLEGTVLGKSGLLLHPDIITWDNKRKVGTFVDVTNNPSFKTPQVEKYKTADVQSLSALGVPQDIHPEFDVVVSLDKAHDTSEYCQIIVGDIIDVIHEDNLSDSTLKDKLIASKDFPLNRLPDLKISLLPEMTGASEIRTGLSGYVYKLFEPNFQGYTVKELTDEGLGEFVNRFSPASREKLMSRVENNMRALVQHYLPDYLEEVDRVFRAKKEPDRKTSFAESPRTRKAITDGIYNWIHNKTEKDMVVQYQLDNFSKEGGRDA